MKMANLKICGVGSKGFSSLEQHSEVFSHLSTISLSICILERYLCLVPWNLETYKVTINDLFWRTNLNAHLFPIIAHNVEYQNGLNRFTFFPKPQYQPMHGTIDYNICDLIYEDSRKITP